MQISNINDLSEIIKEAEKVYTFRKLEKQDAQELMLLMTDAFVHRNDVFLAAQSIESDMNSDGVLQEQQKLYISLNKFINDLREPFFGAFHEEKLVSACLSFDLSRKQDIEVDSGIEPTQAMKDIGKIIKTFLDKYADTKSLPKNEISYLNYLATSSNYCKQNLALICSYLSVLESRKQGFKKMLTGAGHVATFKAFTKIFKEYEIVKDIQELRDKPIFMKSLMATITPL